MLPWSWGHDCKINTKWCWHSHNILSHILETGEVGNKVSLIQLSVHLSICPSQRTFKDMKLLKYGLICQQTLLTRVLFECCSQDSLPLQTHQWETVTKYNQDRLCHDKLWSSPTVWCLIITNICWGGGKSYESVHKNIEACFQNENV